MSLSRRQFILAATGSTLALVGAGGAYSVTRRPQTASAPWSLSGPAPADVRLDAFRHAILAPNPHNRQPWLIRLIGSDEALITCDLDRRLPETDPFDRQIAIGFGCFLELARIAAAERGYRMEAEDFPEGEPQPRLDGRPVARLRFQRDPGVARDPLFAAILARRSIKEPFDMARPVSADLIAALGREGSPAARIAGTGEGDLVERLRAVVLDAAGIEAATPRTYRESVDLMRIGHREIDANPDGIDLDGPMIEGLRLAGLISRDQLADPSSQAYKAGLDQFRTVYGSGLAYAWLVTPSNRRRDQLAAGRAYLRLNLKATQLGLALHPVSQSLQEYPEVAEPFRRVHALVGARGDERVQMLARLGYAAPTPPSPRWPLETRLLPDAASS